MREAIKEWMFKHASEYANDTDLALAASDEFQHVIGIDSFVWNDAKTVFDIKRREELLAHV